MTPKEKNTLSPQVAVKKLFDADVMNAAAESARKGNSGPVVAEDEITAVEYKGPDEGYTFYLSEDYQIK